MTELRLATSSAAQGAIGLRDATLDDKLLNSLMRARRELQSSPLKLAHPQTPRRFTSQDQAPEVDEEAEERHRQQLRFSESLRSLRQGDPTTLSLSSITISAKYARQLGAALAANSTLTKLRLVDCDLGAAECATLSKGVGLASHLTELYLSRNYIGDHGAEALGTALEISSSLKMLSLMYVLFTRWSRYLCVACRAPAAAASVA